MKYTVCVDDNFHYMDESERYTLGDFDTAEAAIAACKQIVDDFLAQGFTPGVSADELYQGYVNFGEDPFIQSDDPQCRFSAWTYARQRCDELVAAARKPPAPPKAPVRPTTPTRPAPPEVRRALESVYHRTAEALERRAALGLLATAYDPEPLAERLRDQFPETIAWLQQQVPSPTETSGVATVTRGDNLAGHYIVRREGDNVRVLLLAFVKPQAEWKLVVPSPSHLFRPRPWQPVAAAAEECIRTVPGLQLRAPSASTPTGE